MSDTAASAQLLAAAKDAAARGVDYYALLGIDAASGDAITPKMVQRAWRKRSVNYHPDKTDDRFDKDKWEEFGLARDVLASDEARAVYDGGRAALLQKQHEREAMGARARRFAEDLEAAEGGADTRRRGGEEAAQRQMEGERERSRLAAEGRRVMEERRRLVREAEERERERERREDEARDDKIKQLEARIADKARRRAEKRARRQGGRRSDVAVDDEVQVPSSRPVSAAAPEPEPKHEEKKTAPIPARDFQMSDDPVRFWETQWPKTKARLLAAQATKERRVRETQTAA